MAKQLGNNPLSGKVDNIVYYSTKDGKRLARRNYEHTGKNVKTSPAYETVRQLNTVFGNRSWFARNIYRGLLNYMPNVLESSFFNDFISYAAHRPNGWTGPQAQPDIVEFMNGKLRNSSLAYLPSMVLNDGMSVTGTNLTINSTIKLPSTTVDFLIGGGYSTIDYYLYAFCMAVPVLSGQGGYIFAPPQVLLLKSQSSINIYSGSSQTLVTGGETVRLYDINPQNLCNWNGGSSLAFGGVFLYVTPGSHQYQFEKDYVIGSYITPILQS